MLKTKKIDDLFCLLRIMTRPWTGHPNAPRLLIMWRLLKFSLSGLVLTVIAYSWLPALWQRFEVTPSELHDALFVVGCLFTAFFVVFITTIIVGLFYIARHRKELVPYLFPKNELHRDAEFITQLLAFDKATLAYGLLQYPHRWLFTQDLVAVLAGDLRKLGLFPALTALLISAAILFKADSNPFLLFLRDLVAIAVIYYLAAFLNFLSNRRPRQVIQLLEYAIQHADQCNSTPPDGPL
jgi:hypothetical protein